MPQYLTKRFVPILDEHELKDDDGNVVVKVDEKRLRTIAEKNNQRIRETGDLTPFVIGHTKDDAKEEEQPQIVAYAANFTVRPFGKTGRKALCVDMKYQAHNRDLINKYPRRSVEMWLDDWKIDPIALLGATTPERDLGLLQLARGGRRKLRRVLGPRRYQMPLPPTPQTSTGQTQAPPTVGEGGGDMQAATIAQAVVAMLQETEEWQFLRQQIEEQQAPPPPMPGMDDLGMPPGGQEPPMPPMPGDDMGGDGYDEEDEYDDEEDEEDDEDEPERYSASAASGTNTFTPGPRRMSRQYTPTAGVQDLAYRLRAAADARRIQYARQQRAMQYMAQDVQNMRLRLQRAEREKDLIQLEAEGVLFDRVEELDAVVGMPEKHYQSHLVRLRKRYQRAPIGRLSFSAEDIRAETGASSGRDKDQAMSVADYALKHGLSYEAAAAKMNGR